MSESGSVAVSVEGYCEFAGVLFIVNHKHGRWHGTSPPHSSGPLGSGGGSQRT